jgi:hypothetical protein
MMRPYSAHMHSNAHGKAHALTCCFLTSSTHSTALGVCAYVRVITIMSRVYSRACEVLGVHPCTACTCPYSLHARRAPICALPVHLLKRVCI